MKTRCLLLFGALALASVSARAEKIALRPGASVDVGYYPDERRLTTPDGETASTRQLWFTRVNLSVGYDIRQRVLPGLMRGQSSLGVGVVYQEGQFPLHLRQELVWDYPLSSWLELEAGLVFGANFNFTNSAGSFWEVSVPLGLRFKKSVELLYWPMLTLPLSAQTDDVFGGTIAARVAPAVVPVGLVVRVSLRAFEF